MDSVFKRKMVEEGMGVGELARLAERSPRTVSQLRNQEKHGISDTTVFKILLAFNKETGKKYTREDLEI